MTNGNITSTGTGVGGIVGGMAGDAYLHHCSFSGTISVSNGGSFCGAGGLVAAAAENSMISDCSFSGSISATNNGGFTDAAGAGGIVGIAMDNASIYCCYNTGNITASSFMLNVAAGILGATLQANNVSISFCYNVGTLNASTKGGIFGMISPINPTKDETSLNVQNCFYLNSCGGTTNYGTSMTSDQMKTEQFTEQLNSDKIYAFVMDNGSNNGYPILSLYDIKIYDATDITAHSAKISAIIHQGNTSFSNAYFRVHDSEYTIERIINVNTDGYVEVILNNLEELTSYNYTLRIVWEDGQYRESLLKWFRTEFDGISEISNSEISIYPNPTSDFIFIENTEPQLVTIYSLDGKLLKTVESTNVIDVRDLNKGIYLINIDNAVLKFVIQR